MLQRQLVGGKWRVTDGEYTVSIVEHRLPFTGWLLLYGLAYFIMYLAGLFER